MSKDNFKAQALMEKGAAAHKEGDLENAELFYKRALEFDMGHADSLHLLGVLLHQKGQHEHAAQLIKRALLIKPDELNYSVNLAIILNAISQWSEAEKICVSVIQIEPKHAEAYNNLGRAFMAQNKLTEAEAAYIKSIEYAPNNSSAQSNLGYLYMQQGSYQLAERAFLRAIKIDDKFLLAYSNLATTYLAMDLLERAEIICRTALSKEPKFVPAMHSLGVVLTRMKNFDAAAQAFKQVMKISPSHSQSILNLASLYSVKGKSDLAKSLFEKVIQLEPENSDAYVNLAVFYSEIGQLDEALIYLKRALHYDPDNIEAYYVLSTSGKVTLDISVINKLEMMLETRTEITADQKTKIHFIMGIQLERLGDTGRSFDYYESGNQHRTLSFQKAGLNFDHNSHYKQFQLYKSTFTKEFFENRINVKSEHLPAVPSPIFIVGMPRSGTTLVEQIISSHSDVMAGGELSIIGGFVDNFIESTGGKYQFPASSECLKLDQIREWSKIFLGELKRVSNNVCYVVDKTPFNYLHLWLIQLMFPDAKIIHCMRDTRDIGLSCFQQNFVGQYPWSCDLKQIGHYINAYSNLMNFWQDVLRVPILNVVYEDLVLALEENSRAIAEFLELEWQNDILDFQVADGKVKTASKWQVREPIYKHSVGRWKKYEKELLPLLRTLERN